MLKKSLPIMLLVGLLVLVFPLVVAAQGGRPPVTGPRFGLEAAGDMAWQGAQRGGWHAGSFSLTDATAQVTGLTVEEVIAALQDGQTFADIAASAGVTSQVIADVLLEARAEALTQAVSDGRFTQEQADTMLETMSTHLLERLDTAWEPRGPDSGYALNGVRPQNGGGMEPGRGLHRGAGAGDCPNVQP